MNQPQNQRRMLSPLSNLDTLEDLLSSFLDLDPQTQMITFILGLGILLIFILLIRGLRRGKPKEKTQKEQAKISKLEKKIELLTAHIQSQPSEDELKVDAEAEEEKAPSVLVPTLYRRIDALKADLSHWKQRAVRGEEIIEQKTNELAAVYKTDRDYNDGVSNLFLSHVANIRDIDRAFKTHKGPIFSLEQAGSTIVALAIIAYLYFNKSLQDEIIAVIKQPRFQLYLVIGLVVLGAFIYLWKRRKKNK